jgi:predicted ATP-dependent endonuclease of OLD family
MYLKKVILSNFKKFKHSEFDLDKGINIVIGHNGSGKSTLLQAIDIALNQRGNGDWKNSSEYGTLLNNNAKQKFFDDFDQKKYVTSASLPSISVELFFDDEENNIHSNIFNGPINSISKISNGITFNYSFDDEFEDEYNNLTNNVLTNNANLDFIPFEFYHAQWTLFSGLPYSFRKNPFKSILINTDKIKGDSYKSFTHQYFSTLDNIVQHKLSLKLKKHISEFNSDIAQLDKEANSLCVDPTRMVVQDTLEVSNPDTDGLLLRDMGSGEENIIKTNLAMSSKNSTLILLEEPENHLSFDLARQQVSKIKGAEDEKRQVVVSTHSPLLASKLNINNLKWLNDERNFVSFKDIPDDTAEFFLKADNIDILQVILARKVVLVEGATEYMIMQNIVRGLFKKGADELGIHIVSMGGNYYKRFKDIVNVTKNKVLVITDNDSSQERIDVAHNDNTNYFHVVMDKCVNNFTFEVALYKENKKFFKSEDWKHISSNNYWKTHTPLDPALVWMLNNKTDAAFEYGNKFENETLTIPSYIKEGLNWLQK